MRRRTRRGREQYKSWFDVETEGNVQEILDDIKAGHISSETELEEAVEGMVTLSLPKSIGSLIEVFRQSDLLDNVFAVDPDLEDFFWDHIAERLRNRVWESYPEFVEALKASGGEY